ncbi:YtxH domain-containing protein [Runella sp.]|jgi:gas vesicle protein|uniref:YtxH domain-containing protein n=1 Tax=Runella sp. TaxID=1960881 RepID=UPI00301ABFE4
MKSQKKGSESEELTSLKKNQSNNRKKSIMNSGKIVLGILASIGVGALIGIVFAPQKGSKIRRKIMQNGENYLDDFKDQFDDFLNEATDKIEKIWKDSEEFIGKEKTKHLDGKMSKKDIVL